MTLLGQDLSIKGGHYVGDSSQKSPDFDEMSPLELDCKSIDGERLPTLPNYFSFIGEFRRIADAFKDTVQLFNCTSQGAYLDGWNHMPFKAHPLINLDVDAVNKRSVLEDGTRPDNDRLRNVHDSLSILSEQFQEAIAICDRLQNWCLMAVDAGSTDLSEIELLEKELKVLMHDSCPMLTTYLSKQSMAVKGAVQSNETMEDNLRISADYYSAISRGASKLRSIARDSEKRIFDGMAVSE